MMRRNVFMRRFTAIVNCQTLIVVCLSFVSCCLTIKFRFTMYADFFIFGLLIAFPITLTTKEAFKRRERAIQYLSLFKASLQSIYYSVINSKLETTQKESFKHISINLTASLIDYLKAKNPLTLQLFDQHLNGWHRLLPAIRKP